MSRIPDRASHALAALTLVAVAACAQARAAPEPGSAAPAAAPAAPGGAPHGANPMAAQEQRLDELLAGRDPLAVPRWVDPVIWASLALADNEVRADRVALGRKLYFDPRLSADGTVACATCHDVLRGFTDRRPVAEGIGDKLGRRNAPSSLNAMFLGTQFWDGRAPSLEAQAILPIVNPIEMGQHDGAAVVAAVAAIPEYASGFQAAYGHPVTYEDVGRALAAFERTLVFLDAPFDRFVHGEPGALSAAAQRGFALFNGKARCVTCHPFSAANPVGSDDRFHNIGVSARHQDFEGLASKALGLLAQADGLKAIDQLALETDASELGRFLVTRRTQDLGAFRTSPLRNIGMTAPYMHDGTLPTLWDVVDHYNKGGEANRFLDGGIEPLALDAGEIDDLVAFLFALTDDRFAAENQAEMARQQAAAAKSRPFRDDDVANRKKLAFEPKP